MSSLVVDTFEDSAGAWVSASRPLRGPLASGADRLQGYEERAEAPVVRREGPVARVVVIVDLGPGLDVAAHPDAAYDRFARGFVAGLTDRAALTRHGGEQRGVEITLDPTVAQRVFGVPMSELAGRVVDLDDVLPRGARGLASRIGSREGWAARLDEVERTLTSQLVRRVDADVGAQVVAWAMRQIAASAGRVDIGALTSASGYSHKHLVRLFRRHVGLAPKRIARIARLEALRARLMRPSAPGFAALAAAHGFTDQAHLAREVRAMVGLTPTDWRRVLAPRSENAKASAGAAG